MNIVMKEYNLESFQDKDVYTWEEIISIIEDLEAELHTEREKREDLERDMEDNYRKVTVEEQIDYSDRW
jgi:Txe/YoeB family toxin of Txe-Axe toxin-antitoxin module